MDEKEVTRNIGETFCATMAFWFRKREPISSRREQDSGDSTFAPFFREAILNEKERTFNDKAAATDGSQ